MHWHWDKILRMFVSSWLRTNGSTDFRGPDDGSQASYIDGYGDTTRETSRWIESWGSYRSDMIVIEGYSLRCLMLSFDP